MDSTVTKEPASTPAKEMKEVVKEPETESKTTRTAEEGPKGCEDEACYSIFSFPALTAAIPRDPSLPPLHATCHDA